MHLSSRSCLARACPLCQSLPSTQQRWCCSDERRLTGETRGGHGRGPADPSRSRPPRHAWCSTPQAVLRLVHKFTQAADVAPPCVVVVDARRRPSFLLLRLVATATGSEGQLPDQAPFRIGEASTTAPERQRFPVFPEQKYRDTVYTPETKEEKKTFMDIKEVQPGGSDLLLKKVEHGFLACLIVVLNISYSPL